MLSSIFDIEVTQGVEDYVPKYNIDPSAGLVVVRNTDSSVADVLEWGFIPEWADDPSDVPTPINARSESVADSKMFRQSFKNKRCLVLADGFFEWQDRRGSKQPYRVVRADGEPFAFAGIWSRWEHDGMARETTAILTTEPNDVVAEIHDRMPVMLATEEHEPWLSGDAATAFDLLDPAPSSDVESYPVSKRVNNPDVESPDLFERVDSGDQSDLTDFGS